MKNSSFIISVGSESDDAQDAADTGPDAELRHLVFNEDQHGQRLDRALVDMVPEFSRSYLQQLIDLGAVSVNGVPMCKPSSRVKAFDVGTIELRVLQLIGALSERRHCSSP